MTSNAQNPFNRPSPFRPSIQNRSTSPYSYGNQYGNIIQSQVRPVLTSNRTNTNPFSQKNIDFKQFAPAPTYRPSSSYNSITSYTNLSIPTSDTRPDISKQYGTNIYQQRPSIAKQNPFNRPSLLNNYTGISSDSNRPSLSFNQNITSNTQLEFNTKGSYDHLRYIPSSSTKSIPKIQSQTNIEKYGLDHGYSNEKYLANDHISLKYPTYNYSSYNNDKSQTSSVCTYINKINELQEPKSPRDKLQNNPFNRKAIFNNPAIISMQYNQLKPQSKKEDEVLIYSGLKIETKDYSHLQYKGTNNKEQIQGRDSISYSSGLDKYRYQYEKERKYQQNDIRKLSVQAEQQYNYTQVPQPGFKKGNLEYLESNYMPRNDDKRSETNQYQKLVNNNKKYEFEDYKQEDDFRSSPPKNNRFEEVSPNFTQNKYHQMQHNRLYKRQSFQNQAKIAYQRHNDDTQSDRYDFKNEDQLDRVEKNYKKNDFKTYQINQNRVSHQSYQSPQFGTLNPANISSYQPIPIKQKHQNYTKKVAQNQFNRANIVRFDDSFESEGRQISKKQRNMAVYESNNHYVQKVQERERQNKERRQSKRNGPIKELKEDENHSKQVYPNRIRHKGIQYELVKLFS